MNVIPTIKEAIAIKCIVRTINRSHVWKGINRYEIYILNIGLHDFKDLAKQLEK